MGEEARMSKTQGEPTRDPPRREASPGAGAQQEGVPTVGLRPRPTYLKLMLAQTSMSLSRKTLRSLDLISCPRSPYTVSVSVSHRSSCL